MKAWIKDWWYRQRQKHCRVGSSYETRKYCLKRAARAIQEDLEHDAKRGKF